MRRLLTFLTAAVLLLVSLGVGVFTADLPFWRRALALPLAPDAGYLPVARIGSAPAGAVAAVEPQENSIEAAALAAAADLARASGASALLVMHRGHLQLEAYFDGQQDPFVLRSADFVARPLAALAVGLALGERRIKSLDEPVARYLHEWADEPRGRITLRELLQETSGLQTGSAAAALFAARPFADLSHLPAFATSRGVRLLLGNDFEATALGFELDHEPGGFFNVSPVNTQLAAVIVERASGEPYEDFLERRLRFHNWNFAAELFFDRRSGMPAAHCCMRAGARDVLYLAEMLRNDGRHLEEAVFPAGWVAQMRGGSRANPEFGLQLERLRGGALEIWHVGSGQGGALWIVPAAQLTVVVLAPRGVSTPAVLDLLLHAERK